MKKDLKNPFCALAELKVTADLNGDQPFPLFAQLNFGQEYVDLDEGFSIEVKVNSAVLKLVLEGAEAVQGTEAYNQERPVALISYEAEKTRTLEKKTAVGGGLTINAAEFVANASANRDANLSTVSDEKLRTTQEWNEHHVRYTSGGNWQIRNIAADAGTPLEGKYLSNETIVEIEKGESANRALIECFLMVRKRDFEIEPEGTKIQKKYRSLVHKEKFMKAIIARALENHQASENSGWIVISKASLFDEQDDDDQQLY